MSHDQIAGSSAATGTDPTLGGLVVEVSRDISKLVHQEIELAKTELKQEATSAGKGVGMFGGAGVTALYLVGFASLTVVFALAKVMDHVWAALIVTVFWALVTGVLALLGRKNLKQATPPLEQTKQSLKEDAQWVKTRKS